MIGMEIAAKLAGVLSAYNKVEPTKTATEVLAEWDNIRTALTDRAEGASTTGEQGRSAASASEASSGSPAIDHKKIEKLAQQIVLISDDHPTIELARAYLSLIPGGGRGK